MKRETLEVITACHKWVSEQLASAREARNNASDEQALMLAGKVKAYTDVACFIQDRWLKHGKGALVERVNRVINCPEFEAYLGEYGYSLGEFQGSFPGHDFDELPPVFRNAILAAETALEKKGTE